MKSKPKADIQQVENLINQINQMRNGIDKLMSGSNNIRINEALWSIQTHLSVALDSIDSELSSEIRTKLS